jgi:hypothetical protein
MVAWIVVVEFNPVVVTDSAQTHGYEVFGSISERAIWQGLGFLEGPVWVRWWLWTPER